MSKANTTNTPYDAYEFNKRCQKEKTQAVVKEFQKNGQIKYANTEMGMVMIYFKDGSITSIYRGSGNCYTGKGEMLSLMRAFTKHMIDEPSILE